MVKGAMSLSESILFTFDDVLLDFVETDSNPLILKLQIAPPGPLPPRAVRKILQSASGKTHAAYISAVENYPPLEAISLWREVILSRTDPRRATRDYSLGNLRPSDLF